MLVVDHEGFEYTRIVRQVYNELALIGSNTRNIFFACLILTIYIGGPLRELEMSLAYAEMKGKNVESIKEKQNIWFLMRYFFLRRHPWLYNNLFCNKKSFQALFDEIIKFVDEMNYMLSINRISQLAETSSENDSEGKNAFETIDPPPEHRLRKHKTVPAKQLSLKKKKTMIPRNSKEKRSAQRSSNNRAIDYEEESCNMSFQSVELSSSITQMRGEEISNSFNRNPYDR